ncbi:MAG TPA: hypothetical protein GXZ43_01355 [Clostridiaceae bacterium]|nr:hypothetical protein [Clostridiaceae bacterium]
MADELNNNNQQQDSGTNSATDPQQGTQSQSPDAQGNNAGSEKTFTQEDVNNIVSQRLEQEKKKMPSKEELEAFKKWQEDQKTAEEKRAEKDAEYNQMQAELNLYKNKEKVTKAGINPEFAEFAVFEVSKQVNDSTDFDTALTSWIEANPQYKVTQEEPEDKPPAIVIPQANTEKVKEMNQIMNNIIRGKRGN